MIVQCQSWAVMAELAHAITTNTRHQASVRRTDDGYGWMIVNEHGLPFRWIGVGLGYDFKAVAA